MTKRDAIRINELVSLTDPRSPVARVMDEFKVGASRARDLIQAATARADRAAGKRED